MAKIDIQLGRGSHKKIIGKRNRQRVLDFFTKNQQATVGECCQALGLCSATVRAHIAAINAEHESAAGGGNGKQ